MFWHFYLFTFYGSGMRWNMYLLFPFLGFSHRLNPKKREELVDTKHD